MLLRCESRLQPRDGRMAHPIATRDIHQRLARLAPCQSLLPLMRRELGCFQSQVVGAGPQLGFIIPLTTETQGYLNLKSYWEFANQNRPDGWNAWVTFVISPAEKTPSTAPRRMITK